MEHKDYYGILGIKQNATKEEVKAAYRRMAFRYHPDRNPNNTLAENKLVEINEAYQVLSDPLKRAQYHRVSREYERWKRTQPRRPSQGKEQPPVDRPGWEKPHDGAESGRGNGLTQKLRNGFSVVFDAIYQCIGRLLEKEELDDVTRSYNAPHADPPPSNTPRQTCQEREVTISLSEAFHGTARTVISSGRRFEVKIPPGTRNGTKVKVRRAGPLGADGNKQDVVLAIRVLEDAKLKRKGDDLYMDAFVNLYTAILGGETSVSCLDRNFLLSIPAGTQPEQIFRLKGKGMPKLSAPHEFGDLYMQVKIALPEKLSDHQRALFEMLAQSV